MEAILNQHLWFVGVPLVLGWLLDKCLGDPHWLPHPVVGFGKIIAKGEQQLNRGKRKKLKGTIFALSLVVGVLFSSWILLVYLYHISIYLYIFAAAILIFCCLAGTTLIQEVRNVFLAVEHSLEDGRQQVARIVGRDTSRLSPQEVRTAALETLAENLSDGVIAPLFWLILFGIPGMLAYKMVNTLDSMIGYRSPRYKDFGCFAARMDDFFNYIPARLTAFLMLAVAPIATMMQQMKAGKTTRKGCHEDPNSQRKGIIGQLAFLRKYASQHASPNSGWPESALAAILDCRFGGPHDYFGQNVYKPFIGENDRELDTYDMELAVRINLLAECLMIPIALGATYMLFA